MAKSSNHIVVMVKTYYRTSFRSGGLALAAIFSAACFFFALKQRPQSVEALAAEPALLTIAAMFAILLAPSVLQQDIETKRILLWTSCGLTRTSHYLSRFAYILTQLFLLLILPFSIITLAFAHKYGSSQNVPWILGGLILVQLQMSAFLTMISTVVQSYWNSVCSAGATVLGVLLFYQYRITLALLLTPLQVRCLKTILVSPIILMRDCLLNHRAFLTEAEISLTFSVACTLLGILAWNRKELIIKT